MSQPPCSRVRGARSILSIVLSVGLSMAALPFVGCGTDGESNDNAASGGVAGTGATSGTGPGGSETGGTANTGTGGTTNTDCGASGQECCSGETCADGGCCVDGLCVAEDDYCDVGEEGICRAGQCETCGHVGQDCCGIAECLPGIHCDPGGTAGICVPCGDGEPCCADKQCADGAGVCVYEGSDESGVLEYCHADCGDEGQDCCKNDQCALGFECNAGKCVETGCGSVYEACCPNDQCEGGTGCLDGSCALVCDGDSC